MNKTFINFVSVLATGCRLGSVALASLGIKKVLQTSSLKQVDIKDFCLVQVSWVFMYYGFLFTQSTTHFRVFGMQKKKLEKSEQATLFEIKRGNVPKKLGREAALLVSTVNTTVRNTVEQSIIFLSLFWASYLMGEGLAVPAGYARLGFRLVYPELYRLSVTQKLPLVFLSTIPGYNIIFFMCLRLVLPSFK